MSYFCSDSKEDNLAVAMGGYGVLGRSDGVMVSGADVRVPKQVSGVGCQEICFLLNPVVDPV